MIAKYALSAAALLQLARAQSPSLDGDTALAGEVSSDQWASVAEDANMTRQVTITGRDVSESYPGSEQEWNLKLALKDDLETDGDSLLTAGTISIWPEGGDIDMDDSWQVCLHVFNVKASSSGGFGSATNGCDGLVATECVDDLRKRARSNFEGGCPSFKTTESCLRDVSENSRGAVSEITPSTTDTFVGNDTSFYRRAYGTHSADQEEPETLLEAAGLGQVVVAVWGPASGNEDGERWVESTCLLPDTVTEGSYDPEEEEGAASGFGAFAGWVAFTAAAAYQLL